MNRGLSVVSTYQILLGRPLTKEEKFKAQILGWCVEWVSDFFFVLFLFLFFISMFIIYKHYFIMQAISKCIYVYG